MKAEELDLSYGGLVDYVQGEPAKGNELIEILTEAVVSTNEQIEEAEARVKAFKAQQNHYRGGIEKILKHLQVHPPLNYLFNGKLYAINENYQVAIFEIANVPAPLK